MTRPGLYLQPRDHAILNHQRFGPVPQSSIFNTFFNTANANIKTRWGTMTRRLKMLENGGLVKRLTSPDWKETIYVLTQDGALKVAARHGYDINNVFYNVNPKNIEHDLIVSAVARKIKKEATQQKHYKLANIQLECAQRSAIKQQKGAYFSDLKVNLIGPTALNEFDIEVDRGTVSRRDIIGKILFFSGTVLVVTNTKLRLALILRYMEFENIEEKVYVITMEEFFKNALVDCQWHTNRSDNLEKLSLI